MKKFLNVFIMLVLALFILEITPSYADNVAVNETESFSWSVPASIELDDASALNVAITNSTIGAGKKISISLTESTNYENNKFYLKLGETSTKVEYEIVNTSNQVQSIGSNLVVLESGYSSANSLFTARAVGNFTYAGTYTDRLSFVATCIANTYTVNYNGNGATSGSTASSSHTCGEAKALTLNGFANRGYTFVGWTTSDDGTGTLYTDGQSVTNLSTINGATVNLYAKWKPNICRVNIDANGGNGGTTVIYEKYNDGWYSEEQCTNKITNITVPTRTGYTLDGFFIGDNTYVWINSSGQIVTGPTSTSMYSITLTARWTPKNYTITLNNNSATTAGTTSVTAAYEQALPNITVPTKTDYVFDGYYNGVWQLVYSHGDYGTIKRVNMTNSTGNYCWAMTTADKGFHIKAKIEIKDETVTSQPSFDFNDVPISATNVEHVGDTWIAYFDFEITEAMVSVRQGFDYETNYRFIDINNVNAGTTITVDYLERYKKKYYGSNGVGVINSDLLADTTLYAGWIK